jgi:hypothetical protein
MRNTLKHFRVSFSLLQKKVSAFFADGHERTKKVAEIPGVGG